MTKKKAIKDTQGAKDNRATDESIAANVGPLLAPRHFDNLGLDDIELIRQLEKRGWWGFLEKGPEGETRGIEVRQ